MTVDDAGAAVAEATELTAEIEEFDADAHVAEALNSGNEEAPAEIEATEDDSSGIEIGGEKYELPALEELITLGKDAKEIKANATRKLQEAARERERVAWADQLEAEWNKGPEGRAKMIANLQKLDREQGGGFVAPQETTEEVSYEDMSPEGRFLYRGFIRLQAENAALRNEVTPTLKEASTFLGQTKADKQNEAWAQEISATHGVQMTAGQVAEMLENGIADPVKAFGMFKPKFQELYAKGHEQGAKPKPETPEKSRSKVFDDSNMSADDIVQAMMRGGIAASSLKK